MERDFMKRGYLLPKGCKDLIDVLKLKPNHELKHQLPQHFIPLPSPLPPVWCICDPKTIA